MIQRQIDILQQQWLVAHAVGRCLHVGSGTKPIRGAINIDPDPNRYAWANVAAEGLRLPFEDGVFDSMVSSHVLPLFPDINAVMREFARVLASGGIMAHVVPDLRYAPDRFTSRHKFERQAQGWHGPAQFKASLHGLDNVLHFFCIENFREFNWSFKVEAVRL